MRLHILRNRLRGEVIAGLIRADRRIDTNRRFFTLVLEITSNSIPSEQYLRIQLLFNIKTIEQVNALFHRHRLGQVPRLIYVAATPDRRVICQQLQRQHGQHRRQERRGLRHV
jgi:hypothetical protein